MAHGFDFQAYTEPPWLQAHGAGALGMTAEALFICFDVENHFLVSVKMVPRKSFFNHLLNIIRK